MENNITANTEQEQADKNTKMDKTDPTTTGAASVPTSAIRAASCTFARWRRAGEYSAIAMSTFCNNPARLTRSEFRLCMLVQEGGLPDKVADVLQISKSTFRSHLRSIYSKTGVTGHVELVHLLHQSVVHDSDNLVLKILRS